MEGNVAAAGNRKN